MRKDSGMTTEIKIMIFPVKFDKLTGFFDKFLKIVSRLTGCNAKSYLSNLSVLD